MDFLVIKKANCKIVLFATVQSIPVQMMKVGKMENGSNPEMEKTFWIAAIVLGLMKKKESMKYLNF